MSRRETIVNEIMQRRLSAIVRADDQELARAAMRSAVDGGFTLVEFTLTTPGAIELIGEFAREADLLVGAGTVLGPDQAKAAVDAGARFLVSPICDAKIIAVARELDVASIPGTHTATEMEFAHRSGADFVKLFPAPASVAHYVASLLAPLPHLRIIPTNGVTLDNLADVLAAGAAGVGFAAPLFEPHWMTERNFPAIRERAAALIVAAK